MAIDLEYRKKVIAQALTLLFEERIPEDADLPISEAWRDDEKFRVVEEAVSSYQKSHGNGLAPHIIKPLPRFLHPLFYHNVSPEVRHTTKAIAGRAEEIPLDSIRNAQDFEKRTIGEDPEAGNLPGNGVFVATTVREEVWFTLADRMLKRMLGGRRDSSGRYEMLPPPGNAQFKRSVMRRFKIDSAQFEAWKRMPAWKTMIIDLFYTLMGEGFVKGSPEKPLENRENTIELRKAWFDGMVAAGVGKRELRSRMAIRILSFRSENDLRAGGWLRRFMPDITLSESTAGARAAVLIAELEELHAMAPYLGERKFVGLLPNLVDTFTIEGMRKALRAKDIPSDGLSIFRADTILLWHAKPSKALAERLLYLVERNKKYTSLNEFSKRMLGTSSDALHAKLAELKLARIDIGPLEGAMEKKFGHSPKGTSAARIEETPVEDDSSKVDPKAEEEEIMQDNRIQTYVSAAGDTFTSIARKLNVDPVLLYIQNASAGLVENSADRFVGPLKEHEVNISFTAKSGEHLDRVAQRLRLDPAFLIRALRKNGIEPEWKKGDSWAWYELGDAHADGAKIMINEKVTLPQESLIEGAVLYMPWAERPIRESVPRRNDETKGVNAEASEKKRFGGVASSKAGTDKNGASKANGAKAAALLDGEKKADAESNAASGSSVGTNATTAAPVGTSAKVK